MDYGIDKGRLKWSLHYVAKVSFRANLECLQKRKNSTFNSFRFGEAYTLI